MSVGASVARADSLAVDFESPAYTTGSVDHQPAANTPPSTWGGQYPPGISINTSLDQGVTSADAHAGAQSFRMSSFYTSGSFGDQVFSPSLADEAGEPGAIDGGFSGGTLQARFTATVWFKSTISTAQNSHVVISPDRGDGARMSWIQVSDNVVDPPSTCSDTGSPCATNADCTAGVADCLPDGRSGLSVSFYDYRAPANILDCGGQQDTEGKCFVFATLATNLSRTTWHRIDLEMEFYAGEANDVVRVSVDGGTPFRGTSWEDYFRNWQNPPFTSPPTVDSLLFRAAGTAEGAQGQGFYFDDLSYASGPCQAAARHVAPGGSDTFNDCRDAGAPCATVQHAVDSACAGDTINVAAGTYTEQVTVGKSVTITGAGAASAIVQAPAVLNGDANGFKNIVTISGSGVNADVSGLTVSGPGPSGCGSINAGIFVRDGANANIHDNTISDIRDNPLSGCQNGQGIWVGRQAFATSGTATIVNNVISGYQKTGIVVDNAGSTATILDNQVTGVGASTAIAQNGIQVSRGATASVSGNRVTGNECDDTSAGCGADPVNDVQSVGILLYQAGSGTTVSANTDVSANDIGIYNLADGTAITGNTFANNRYEGIFLDQGDATVASNTVSGGNIAVAVVSFTGNTENSSGTLRCNQLTGATAGVSVIDQDSNDAFTPLLAVNSGIIEGNGSGVVNTSSSAVDATGNWWGCFTGPNTTGCDTVAGNVAFTPFATAVPGCLGAAQNSLVLTRATLRRAPSATRSTGSVAVYALVNDNDTGGGLQTELLAQAATLEVTDSGVFNAHVALTGCKLVGRKGRVVCRAPGLIATFRPVPGPLLYRMHVRQGRLAATATGSQSPVGPVSVVLHQGTVDRVDQIGNIKPCTSRAHGALLSCYEP